MRRASDTLISLFEKEFPVTGLHSDFWDGEVSSQLNGLPNRDGVLGMLEGEDYQSIDIGFAFICAFVTRLLEIRRTGSPRK